MDLPNPVPVDAPNPVELNPVDAGAEGAEEAEVADGCPNTEAVEVVVPLFAAVRVVVGAEEATVLITGGTPTVVLSVVTGGG